METDININDILREVITFLECLREAQLPLTLENLREKLLARSKNILGVTTSSPEPYLDMKSGLKSFLLTRNEADSEEYVGMEESQEAGNPQDYYESFESDGQAASSALVANDAPGSRQRDDRDDRDDRSQMLVDIYKNLSAMQIRSKCYKCGPLYRREGKKLFLSESRACWIAVVGSYLLIYRSERHARPYAIYPIRGYMARPAPTMILRDRRKSESAFEMYSPGNETLQFIARTPKDMDQWVAKICEVGYCNESEREREEIKRRSLLSRVSLASLTDRRDEAEKSSETDRVERKDPGGKAPPLPARIPRRLPSLPPADPLAEVVPSYRATVEGDEEDDDDIYHRIEDLRNETRYQNIVLSKKKRANAGDERQERVLEAAQDDVRTPNEKMVLQETYDDVVTNATASRGDATSVESERNRSNATSSRVADEEREEEFYDDVENLIPNRRFAKDHAKNQIEMSSKVEKKSFLNRVLSRRESSGKSDKRHRYKSKVSSNSSLPLDTEELPTYDDVSALTSNEKSLADKGEELAEYNCPPPPRPIYEIKSPAKNQSPTKEEIQDFYDDVGAYQERRNKNHEEMLQSTRDSKKGTRNTDSETTGEPAPEETEHYQSPRSDPCVCDAAEMEQNEELYDDIALWADFTARQRDIVGKRESEDAKSVSPDKKAWTRFSKKSRVTSDFNCSSETNRRGVGLANEEMEDSPENNGPVKRNTFLKLISRMENSLAKVSVRGPASVSTGKSSAASNSS